MLLLFILIGHDVGKLISLMVKEYAEQAHVVGSGEIFRIEQHQDNNQYVGQIQQNYYLVQQMTHNYGQIIHLQKYYQEYKTFILILSKMNGTIYVRQIQWENLNNQATLFQKISKQLDCFQIEVFGQLLILDCNENNIDLLYIINVQSQSYVKYLIQQIDNNGLRRIMALYDRKKIFIIRGNTIQAYQFHQINKIQFLYNKNFDFDFDPYYLEWTSKLKNILMSIDSKSKIDYQRTIQLFTYEILILWNENKMLQICDRSNQHNCQDLLFIPQVKDIQLHQKQLMVQSKDFIYFYHFENNQSTLINVTDIVLTNIYSNQFLFVMNNQIKVFIIDIQLQNFIQLSNGSLLTNYNSLEIQQKYFQIDLSTHVTLLSDVMLLSQSSTQNKRVDFPFVGGSLEFKFESQYLDISIRYIQFIDEFNCDQIFLLKINEYYLYCLIGDQLNLYESNEKAKFRKLLTEQINGNITQIYSYVKTICINVYFNSTQVFCNQLFYNDSFILEHQKQVLGIGEYSLMWLEDSFLHIEMQTWKQIYRIEQSYNVKFENKLIIVFCKIHINVFIEKEYYHKVVIIDKCQDFLDFICLQFYCVQICQSEIRKYAILKDYLLYCGYINLYHIKLDKYMKFTSSHIDYFYVWDESQILEFSANRPLNQGFVTTIKFQRILNLFSINKLLCIDFADCQKCYYLRLSIEIELNERLYNNSTNQLCAQNYYDKKCMTLNVSYYKRDRTIKLKQKNMIVKIKENQQTINLGSGFYQGNVDEIKSNKFNIRKRIQKIKEIYYRRIQAFLIIQNLYVVLADKIVLFNNLQTNESYQHQISHHCFHMVPVQNFIYFMCSNQQSILFECLEDQCSFHSFQKQGGLRYSKIRIYENSTIGLSNQDRIITLSWQNNTIQESEIQFKKYRFFDFCLIDQQICLIQIDISNKVILSCNNQTNEFQLNEFIKEIDDKVNHDILMTIQYIDDHGNFYIKTTSFLHFFQFRLQQNPIYYGKILSINEKISIYQYCNQYLLMLQKFNYAFIYLFKLEDLQTGIYYKINLQGNYGLFQAIVIYVYDSRIILQFIYSDIIQLKLLQFDYILESDQPIHPQELKLILSNDEFNEEISLVIDYESQNNYFFICSLLLIIVFIKLRLKRLSYDKNQ